MGKGGYHSGGDHPWGSNRAAPTTPSAVFLGNAEGDCVHIQVEQGEHQDGGEPPDDNNSPLRNDDMLVLVLRALGPGHWLFVTVNHQFLRAYRRCSLSTVTTYENALSSVSRLRFACEAVGRTQSGKYTFLMRRFNLIAGAFAPEPVLEWARKNGMTWSAAVLLGAARAGRLSIFQLPECPPLSLGNIPSMADAWPGPTADLLQWLYSVPKLNWSENAAVRNALSLQTAKKGDLDTLQWLHDEGILTEDGALPELSLCVTAARYGHTRVLQWLRAQQFECGAAAATAAASNGHCSTLGYLLDSDCPWDSFTLPLQAASTNQVEILHWMQQRGLDNVMRSDVLGWALMFGSIKVAAFARAAGIPWPARMYLARANSASRNEPVCWTLEGLQWALAHACPIDICRGLCEQWADAIGHDNRQQYNAREFRRMQHWLHETHPQLCICPH